MRRWIPPDEQRCRALTEAKARCIRSGHYFPDGIPKQIRGSTGRLCGTHLRIWRQDPSRITWAVGGR